MMNDVSFTHILVTTSSIKFITIIYFSWSLIISLICFCMCSIIIYLIVMCNYPHKDCVINLFLIFCWYMLSIHCFVWQFILWSFVLVYSFVIFLVFNSITFVIYFKHDTNIWIPLERCCCCSPFNTICFNNLFCHMFSDLNKNTLFISTLTITIYIYSKSHIYNEIYIILTYRIQ